VLKRAALGALHIAGGLHIARWMNRKGLRILMYHHFSEREPLERQCAHIRSHFAPVSLSQVGDWLEHGTRLPDNALAVTVDDGYRNFYRVAYPVFREYGIPAIVYLVSDFLDGKLWLWVDRVRYAFRHSARTNVEIEMPGNGVGRFILGSPEERKAAALAVNGSLKTRPNPERLQFLGRLTEQLSIRLPELAPEEYAPMTWTEVQEAAAHGIEFGAHTRTHPILSRVEAQSELMAEIAGSKQRIEEELGRPTLHFCYPNGSARDISAEAVATVRAAGFQTAVTTQPGLNYALADPFTLRRIGVEPGLEPLYFERCAAALAV